MREPIRYQPLVLWPEVKVSAGWYDTSSGRFVRTCVGAFATAIALRAAGSAGALKERSELTDAMCDRLGAVADIGAGVSGGPAQRVGKHHGKLAMINPLYEILSTTSQRDHT